MLIPPGLGARLVIASDGVWDGYYGNCQERVAKLVRRTACASAATKIISTLVHSDSLRDDTSVVVIDLTTPGSDFPQVGSGLRVVDRFSCNEGLRKLERMRDQCGLFWWGLHGKRSKGTVSSISTRALAVVEELSLSLGLGHLES